VLRAAGPAEGAAHIAFCAPDRSTLAQPAQSYGGSIPLDKAIRPEVLLAWQMNGAALPPLHGGPVRVVVPGYIGARSVKWIEHITVQDAPSDNFFQAVAYRLLPPDADATSGRPGTGFSLGSVALNCDVLSPEPGAKLGTGRNEVTGYTFAGDDRTVVRVDVSVDGARSWVQAELDEPASPWTWQLWRTEVDLGAGPTTILARAWDSTGALQPESAAQLWNPKGYLNNSWAQVTVTAS
jgi:sulfite oxidase